MSEYLEKWKRAKIANTRVIDIYMAGNYTEAKHSIGQYCCDNPYCLSIVKTDYIYTDADAFMGHMKESGFKVTLINYPRFPEEHDKMESRAIVIAKELARVCDQGSFTIVSNKLSKYYSRRKGE